MVMKQGSVFSNPRRPAVAGLFYPDDPKALRQMVDGFLEEAPAPAGEAYKAFILPHAGYLYSGPVAGTGYRCLCVEPDRVRRVVLLGPAHRVAFRGMAISSHDAFATPLGRVAVDEAAIESIRDLPQVVELDQAHEREHSLEVHVPFLQVSLREFQLVPLVVGDARAVEVAEVLDRLWGGDETCIIISSDLSHYHTYERACGLDRETARRIEGLDPVSPEQACGAVPLNGLLHVARNRGMTWQLLDLRNSGDTAGPRDRVVGYGAFAGR
jgi:AmmeMemoRadiSam system protein B